MGLDQANLLKYNNSIKNEPRNRKRGRSLFDVLIAIQVIMPRKSIIDAAETLHCIIFTEPIMDANISRGVK